MRIVTLLALILCAVVASAGELHDKMIGQWKPDVEKLEEVMVAAAVEKGQDEAQVRMMLPMMKQIFAQMTVTFDAESMTMVMPNPMTGEAKTQTMTYKVLSEADGQMQVEMTKPEGGTDTGVAKFEGDHLVLTGPDGMAIPLLKIAKAETTAAE